MTASAPAGPALPVVALYLAWLAWLCRRVRPPGLALAVLFTWCLAALASAVWLPGGSWFFLWPLALALAGWALLPLARRTLAGALAGVVATVLVPLLVIALMTPMLLGQDEAMGMAAAPFTLALVIWVLALLRPALALVLRPRPMAFLAPGLLALAGIGVLAWALSVAGIDAQRPLPENLEYIADPGRGEALWVSTDATPGPWARRHLGDDARRAPLPDWLPPLPSAADTAWQSAAPVLRDDAPDLQLLSETLHDDGLRQLRLRLLGPAGGHATVLGQPPDVPVTGLRIDGRPAPAGLAGQGLEITWYAVPGEGAEVELSVPAGAPLLLRLRSNIPGLPADAAGRGDEPPPHSMPAGPWTGAPACCAR